MESVWQTYGLVIVALVIGFFKAGFGVGTGLFTSSIASLFLSPRIAIPFTAPLMLFSDLITLQLYRGHLRINLAFKLIIPALIGTIVGSQLLLTLSESLIRQLIGFGAIVFVLYQISNPSVSEPPPFIDKLFTKLIFGFFAGLFSGFAHTGGTFLIMYLVFLSLPKEEFIATVSQLLLGLNTVKLATYLSIGLLPVSTLVCGILLIPFLLVGGMLARRMNRCLSNQHYADLVLIAIWISGLALLIR